MDDEGKRTRSSIKCTLTTSSFTRTNMGARDRKMCNARCTVHNIKLFVKYFTCPVRESEKQLSASPVSKYFEVCNPARASIVSNVTFRGRAMHLAFEASFKEPSLGVSCPVPFSDSCNRPSPGRETGLFVQRSGSKGSHRTRVVPYSMARCDRPMKPLNKGVDIPRDRTQHAALQVWARDPHQRHTVGRQHSAQAERVPRFQGTTK